MKESRKQGFYQYALVFCVPVLLIGMLLWGYWTISIHKDAQQMQLASFEQVTEALDVLKKRCDTVAERTQESDTLLRYLENGDNEAFITQWLSTHEEMSLFSVKLALYQRHNRQIYLKEGPVDYAEFESEIGNLPASLAGLYVGLNQVSQEQAFMLDSGNQFPYGIAYLYPLVNEDAKLFSCLCILVPNATIMDVFNRFFDSSQTTLAIVSATGQPLVITNSFDRNSIKAYRSLVGTGIRDNGPDGNPVMHFISPQTGQRYFLSMPVSVFYGHGQNIYQVLLLIGLCAFIGIVLAFLISRAHWQRLKNSRDENGILNYQLNERVQIIRELVLNKLIDGNIKEETEIRYHLQCANISMDEPYFCLAAVSFSNDSNMDEILEQAENLCLNSGMEKSSCFCVTRPENNQLLLLLNTENSRPAEQLANTIRKLIRLKYHVFLAAGISEIHHHVYKFDNALVEARVAMQEHMNESEDRICQFRTPSDTVKNLSMLSVEKALFAECIRNGNEQMLLSYLQQIFGQLVYPRVNSHLIKCICFSMINICIELCADFHFPLSDSEISKLCAYQSTEILRLQIEECLQNLFYQTRQLLSESMNDSKYHLVDFVQQHYRDPELSLTILAEQFQLTQSYISKLFKEETGQTFVSYVRQLRFQYVKQELKFSDRSIKDIVQEAGYQDVANFSRLFKTNEGVTPGEYRRICQEKTKA